jgi:hypothetical protein
MHFKNLVVVHENTWTTSPTYAKPIADTLDALITQDDFYVTGLLNPGSS